MLGILAAVILAASVGTVLYLRFALQPLDWPNMENPAAPMLELLNAQWLSEDGVWSARIDGYKLYLSYRQEPVYSGNFSFDFHGDDLNAKTELTLHDQQFESEDGSISSTMESLYVENGRLYLDITTSKEGEGSIRQQAVLDRKEQGEPAGTGSEKIREVSEMAELVEFSWNQITIGDNGFRFHIVCAGQDPIDARLSCRYMDREAHEIVQIGDEGSIELCPTISSAQWEELADFLHKAALPAYREPDPSPAGDMEVHTVPFVSKIQVTWRDGGEEFTNSYRGHYADELLGLLKDIARETNSQKGGQPKPAENESGEMRKVSEMAELVEFSWHQSAMSYGDCFDFWIKTTEGESAAPRLCCDYTDMETGERIKLGKDDIGFQGYELDGTKPAEGGTWPTIPLERWAELSDFLRKAELSAYSPPPPNLLDATDSKIQVTWREDGEEFTNRFGGGPSARELRELLQDIAREVK